MLITIGAVEVWRILESVDPFLTPEEFFVTQEKDVTEVVKKLAPRQLDNETGEMLLPIQGFLLKTPHHRVLIDACVGNDKTVEFHPPWSGRKGRRFLAGLAAAGVAPEEIDVVMCTHLHVDHVGWNTRLEDGRWVPTFPNARYLFPDADLTHFSLDPGPTYRESVLPVIEAGQADPVGPNHQIGDFITLVPTPGHTPGHMSVRIESGGRAATITGDALHSTVQCWHPDWNFRYDMVKSRAAASRRALLEEAAESGRWVLGSHFPLPSLGTVSRLGAAFQWTER